MDREQAIEIIEALFPIDSEFEATNRIGRELLEQARAEVGKPYDWRNEPTAVLIRYAELCEYTDQENYLNWIERKRLV